MKGKENIERLGILHMHVLKALYEEPSAADLGLVFQGGTALHLGYGSQRLSEDLDFLVEASPDANNDLAGLMHRVCEKAAHAMLTTLAGTTPSLRLHVSTRNARGHNPRVFEIHWLPDDRQKPDTVLKVEFFSVEPKVLQDYARAPRTFVSPLLPRLLPSGRTATLGEIAVDKIYALASRRYLKYRDVFDLWWLAQSREWSWSGVGSNSLAAHDAMYGEKRPPETLAADACKRLDTANTVAMREELSRFLPATLLGDADLHEMLRVARTQCLAFSSSFASRRQRQRGPQ